MSTVERNGDVPNQQLAKDVARHLFTKGTWRDDIRGEVTRRVREKYRPQIAYDIQVETKWASFQEGERRAGQLADLKREVALVGTGNLGFDTSFVIFDSIDEEVVIKVNALEEKVQSSQGKFTTPPVLEIFVRNGELITINVAEVEQSNGEGKTIDLRQESGLSSYDLVITTAAGHQSGGEHAWHTETDLKLSSFDLRRLHLFTSVDDPVFESGDGVLVLAVGRDVIELIRDSKYAKQIVETFAKYSENTDEMISQVRSTEKTSWAGGVISKMLAEVSEEHEEMGEVNQKAAALYRESGETEYSAAVLVSELIQLVCMAKLGAYLDVKGNLIFVENNEEILQMQEHVIEGYRLLYE